MMIKDLAWKRCNVGPILDDRFAYICVMFQLTNHEAVNQLFSNFTWAMDEPVNVDQESIVRTWAGPANNVFLTLVLFVIMRVRMGKASIHPCYKMAW